jgi:hypothetical protein
MLLCWVPLDFVSWRLIWTVLCFYVNPFLIDSRLLASGHLTKKEAKWPILVSAAAEKLFSRPILQNFFEE